MPLFEYYCADCQAKFELLTPYAKADAAPACQQCHGTRVRRLLSVFAARRGGDGEFNDGYHFSGPDDAGSAGGCCGGGACGCGGMAN